MATWITVCDTCKRDDWTAETRRVPRLMGCSHRCNVALQAQGKLAYILGWFEPDAEAAGAIVDYAEMHAQSETGRAPFREWPQAVKGHFVTRHPSLPSAGS